MGLEEGDVLVSRDQLEHVRDLLYVLAAALEDVERDLRGKPPLAEYKQAFLHLYAAAAALREAPLDPKAAL